MLEAVKNDPCVLGFASKIKRNDKELVMAAVSKDGRALNFASGRALGFSGRFLTCCQLQQNILVGLMVRRKRPSKGAWNRMPSFLRLRCFSYLPVCRSPYDWHASHTYGGLQHDREMVMVAVKQDGFALRYASDALQGDKEVAMAAMAQNGAAFQFVSEELKGDKTVVLGALREIVKGARLEGRIDLALVRNIFSAVSEALRGDEQVMTAAVTMDGGLLQYASNALKNDLRLVTLAMQQQGHIKDTDEFEDVKGLVMAVLGQSSSRESAMQTMAYVSNELKNDARLMQTAMARMNWVKESDDFATVRAMVMHAINVSPPSSPGQALSVAPDELKNDRELVMAAVAINGHAIQHASAALKNAKEGVLAADASAVGTRRRWWR